MKRHNVAIASYFGYHFDVYMALAWTFQRIIPRAPDLRLRIFTTDFRFGFDDIIAGLQLNDVERHANSELLDSLRRTDADVIDMLILGTCEFE